MTMIPKRDITAQHTTINEFGISGLKYKTALSDSSIRWGGLRFGGNILVMLVLLLLMLPVIGSAETEVEGEVSGEWTAEDSPYIVVDSTWVPEDEELRIGPGVDVLFREGIGLDVFGSLTADGNEEDSVRFLPGEDEENWRGFSIHDTEASVDLTYCVMREAENAFLCGDDAGIILKNCNIRSLHKPFGELRPHGDLVSVEMDSCRIEGGDELKFGLSGLIGSNSIIRSGSGEDWGIKSGGYINLDNCTVYGECGDISLPSSEYENCRFWAVNDTVNAFVMVVRRMVDCLVEGTASVGYSGGGEIVFENNIVEIYMGVSICNIRLNNNIFGGDINFSHCGYVIIEDCEIGGTFAITNSNNLQARRCTVLNKNNNINDSFHASLGTDNGEVIIDHCFISGNLRVCEAGQIIISNNTVVTDYVRRWMFPFSYPSDRYTIINNIFLSIGEAAALIYLSNRFDVNNVDLIYNCIWGFESISALDRPFDLDSSNILVDPMIESIDPVNPHLVWNSPCIDAGYPDSPADPDGTRADIGAFYFDCQTVFKDSGEIHPTGFTMYPAYPNPFNASVSVRFQTANSSRIQANIFDLNGRKVFTLPVDYYLPGSHVITWDTHSLNVPSGEYLFQINGEKTSKVAKVVLIR